MRDNAVLQGAARVWREPVLLFNDDTKDCFNQIFLHPSEIWKTSVLWLKLSEIASECQYTHVIEHVFGYGIGNASGFAQRFGNSLLELVARRILTRPMLLSSSLPKPPPPLPAPPGSLAVVRSLAARDATRSASIRVSYTRTTRSSSASALPASFDYSHAGLKSPP